MSTVTTNAGEGSTVLHSSLYTFSFLTHKSRARRSRRPFFPQSSHECRRAADRRAAGTTARSVHGPSSARQETTKQQQGAIGTACCLKTFHTHGLYSSSPFHKHSQRANVIRWFAPAHTPTPTNIKRYSGKDKRSISCKPANSINIDRKGTTSL